MPRFSHLLLTAALLLTAPLPAQLPERYGPVFYGVELPQSGARVLVIVDTSKSMGRKDKERTEPGTRWDTLRDEVRSMTDSMEDLVNRRKVCFTLSFLYEGGDLFHKGTEPFDFAVPGTGERVAAALERRDFTSGGNFEVTFGETLWPLVAKQHITHVFYLGDNDIGRYESEVLGAVKAWYELPPKNPTGEQRKLWNLKKAWRKPWERWRKPAKGVPVFKSQQKFPPPPKDVTFSCIAIGQKSATLEQLATLGHGDYVERGVSQKKKRTKKSKKAPAD